MLLPPPGHVLNLPHRVGLALSFSQEFLRLLRKSSLLPRVKSPESVAMIEVAVLERAKERV